MMKSQTNINGFTLIELVLVMQIVGILFLSALPAMSQIQFEAQVAATKQLQAEWNSAVDMMAARSQLSPTPMGICFLNGSGGMTCTGARPSISDTAQMIFDPFNLGNEAFNPYILQSRAAPMNPIAGTSRVLSIGTLTSGPTFCDSYLKTTQYSPTYGWIYNMWTQRMYATTTDCSKANPSTW